MILDIRTIVFSYVLTDIVCLAVMMILWRQNRKRLAGTGLWVIDYAFQLTALALIILRGIIPDWASIVLANALVMTGALLGYLALLQFAGQRRNQTFNYVFLAANILLHAYFTYMAAGVETRSFNTALGLGVITFQCAWFAAQHPLMRWVGGVFTLFCAVNILRIGRYFTLSDSRTDFFAPSPFDASFMIAYQILFIALTFSVGIMYNKRLVAEIQTGEEKFFKAFHSSPYAITISRTSDGKMLEVNEGFVRISGYTPEECIGKTSLDLKLWPSDTDRSAVVRDLLQYGTIEDRDLLFRVKSGKVIEALFSAQTITINGEACILSSINDISDRKRMESDLRRNETMLRMILDNLPVGIAVNSIEPDVTFTYNNKNFTRFYRITPEALAIPDGFWSAVYEDPLEREKMKSKVLADCETNDPEKMQWSHVPISRSGQETTYINARNIPIPGESLMISAVWDVTDHVQAQNEIQRLNRELEQKVAAQTRELRDSQTALLNLVDDLNQTARDLTAANAALEAVNKELAAFSYSVSHDLRAPLRSIDGFGNALLEDYGDKLNGEGKNYLERIRRATQTMGQLIDDMLNLSRVTQSDFYRQAFDLSALVRNIVETNQQRTPPGNLIVEIQDGIVVRADQRLIKIAMVNLLDNAWKFSGKSENPHIAFGSSITGQETVFFVRDNGAGFDMAYADKLFGAFQRLHRTEEFPGTGIGLATVARIIYRHGGRVWAEGETGKGATFFFTLGA